MNVFKDRKDNKLSLNHLWYQSEYLFKNEPIKLSYFLEYYDQTKVIEKFKNAMNNGIIEGYENQISEWEVYIIPCEVEFHKNNITKETLDKEMEKIRWYIENLLR